MITAFLYRNYRASSSIKHWLKRKFTPAGGLFLGSAVLAAGIGVDTHQAMAYQGFVLLAAILLISFAWSFFGAPGLAAERILPRVGTAGQPLHYRITVANPGNSEQPAVRVSEDLGDPRPTFREFADTPEPGEERRNLFDRFFRFYRWMWLIERNDLAVSVPAQLPALQPRQPASTEARLIPARRGHLHLKGFQFETPDPFGLCRRYSKFAAPQTVLILPKRYRLPRISLGGASHYQPGGVSLASSVGDSQEFLSAREYRHGDPLRHIHWKSTSRTGRLIVKEFQSEFFVRNALILDTFSDDSSSPVFEEAVSIAASFALDLNSQDSLLDLLFVGPESFAVTTGHGVAQVEQMLEILAAVQPCHGHEFGDLADLVLQHAPQVSGAVCILLKWDEERKRLVESLGTFGMPLLVLVLKKPGAPDPVFDAGSRRAARLCVIDTEETEKSLLRIGDA